MEKSAAYYMGVSHGAMDFTKEAGLGKFMQHLLTWLTKFKTTRPWATRQMAYGVTGKRLATPEAGAALLSSAPAKGGQHVIPLGPERMARFGEMGGDIVGKGLMLPAGLMGLSYGMAPTDMPPQGQMSMMGSPIMPNFPIYDNPNIQMPQGLMPPINMPMSMS